MTKLMKNHQFFTFRQFKTSSSQSSSCNLSKGINWWNNLVKIKNQILTPWSELQWTGP